MRKKKRISRGKLQNLIGPTADLLKYVFVAVMGVLLMFAGAFLSFQQPLRRLFSRIGQDWDTNLNKLFPSADPLQVTHFLGGLLLFAGGYGVYRGVRAFFVRLDSERSNNGKNKMVSGFLKRQQLARGPKIVALGGGTGLSTLLRGLKQHSSNITAIVTVTDDGGSSGRLVQDLGIIPPGDMRNCLVALADAEKRMTDLFQHRFGKGSGALTGHSLGNLLIAGFVEQAGGDVDKALTLASEVLAIRGRVLPSTTQHVTLKALMEDGSELEGESAIVNSELKVRRIFLCPSEVRAHAEAIEAIKNADLICMGPGSVFTSVVPNLLVPGIANALVESEATKVYVCNVMTQSGESEGFTAAEHIVAIQANVDQKVFDYILVNTESPSTSLLERYRAEGQEFVHPDVDRIRQMGYKAVVGNFMSETDLVRHDPARVAAKLVDLLYR